MGKPAKSETPKWILVVTGLLGLVTALFGVFKGVYEIRKAQAEAARAQGEYEQQREARERAATPPTKLTAQPPPEPPAFKPTPPATTPAATPLGSADPPAPKAQPVPLFNGRDLDGWSLLTVSYTKDKDRSTWAADPARRVLYSRGGDFQDLQSAQQFKNFVLKLDWRFTPGGNIGANGSGIVIRSQGLNTSGLDPHGIEVDLRSNKNEKEGMGTGCFLVYGTKLTSHWGKADGQKMRHLGWLREPALHPQGQWNSCEVRCRGDRIEVWMNGTVVNEAWGAEEVSGRICLRSQNTAVEFREIIVTPLP